MGLLSALREGPIVEVTRWVKVLDAEDGRYDRDGKHVTPQCDFLLAFQDPEAVKAIGKPFDARQGELHSNPKFRAAFFEKVFRGARGLTKQNARRIFERLTLRPEEYAQLPEGKEILAPGEYDAADAKWVGESLNASRFLAVAGEAMSHDDYVKEQLDQEKNDSAPSSVSA